MKGTIETLLSVFTLMLGFISIPQSAGQTITTLYSFTGGVDGLEPAGPLVRDIAGNIYGVTTAGGDPSCVNPYGCGTVFRLDAQGNKTVLYSFTGKTDGATPVAGLIEDNAGNLYGTTNYGGHLNCGIPSGCGTVFKIDAAGNFKVLYRFTGAPDGANPEGALTRDAQGNLYGTTINGGTLGNCLAGCGTIFKISAAGKETVLYSFTGALDGGTPYGHLVRDSFGNLYGTTNMGGDPNCFGGGGCGVVFKVSVDGTESVLHSFAGGGDANFPQGGLVFDQGAFYGTANAGGAFDYGAVFRIDKAGHERVVHSFGPLPDAGFPSELIHDSAGALYGTGVLGGSLGVGVLYKLDLTGTETLLYSFGVNASDGWNPTGSLIQDAAGRLYGTTTNGGNDSVRGTVFEFVP